jgi:hypothetical protein
MYEPTHCIPNVALAAMPRVSESSVAAVKPGRRRNDQAEKLRS